MRKIIVFILIALAGASTDRAQGQIKETIKELFNDTVKSTAVQNDSAEINAMKTELEQAKSSEMNLRMEVEQLKMVAYAADSLKLAKQKIRIDSIRSVSPGYPVVVEGDTLFTLYAKRGGLSPLDRVQSFIQNILRLGKQYKVNPDSLYVEHTDEVTDIMYQDKVIASVTDLDGLWQNTTRDKLAQAYRSVIVHKLKELKKEHSFVQLIKRISLFILVLAVQYLLFWLTAYFFRKMKVKITKLKDTKLKPILFHNYELFDTGKEVAILIFAARIVKYILMLLQLLITVPILFSIFPQTKSLAMKIFSYLWTPARSILQGIFDYIPNLFTIVVIYLAIKYLIRGLRFLAGEVAAERLKISGFYPDWALPTFHITRFLLYAFMVAMIYPYLPGADSGVFQGVSVFVGLIVSLGSSTVIGNIIAGLVMTYMRPFKIGDRIKLNDTVGNVIEKSALIIRLKTLKNELVTIPNSFIMSSPTTNYSSSAREYGLIIHSEVSIGYDVPWRKVHQLLIDAAKATQGVSADPEPFVLETSLSDFYPVYQINAYIKEADKLNQIYSELHENIQDFFDRADIEIMSPHYIATRDGNASTVPKQEPPAKA